ncbi:MAG: (2Fe-2S) ferredoxin domain-containing protein [Armatimonadota bacterium]|nr:(2Fe-2S) ferredoxin domain-containing protein [bacterium]
MKTLDDLKKVREKALEQMKLREGKFQAKIVVAMGTCGIAAGAREVMTAILDELDKRGISDVSVTQTGCKGLCEQEPTVDVIKDGKTVTYGYIDAEKARKIVAQHIVNGSIIGEWVVATA